MTKQLGHETVDQIIQVALMNIKALIDYYIPSSNVAESKRVMFETLHTVLMREDLEPSTRVPIVDNLFGLVSHKDHITLVQGWLSHGAIQKSNGEELFKLSQKHKYSILKVVYEEPEIPTEKKE